MKSQQELYDVIVIGGGASGLMSAVVAAERGKKVLLIEKNKTLGKKLQISGGGRCNITNAEYDLRTLLSFYGKGEPFLYSAFSQFGVRDTFSFFEKRGLPLMVEARNRAFPKTQKAQDVVSLFQRELAKRGVRVLTGAPVSSLVVTDDTISCVVAGGTEYYGKSVVLATGGVSHPETGSTGDGFGFLKKLGHTVSDPTPSIVPLAVSDAWVHALAGVTLPEIKITFFVEGKKFLSLKGALLCTHFGLSGPLILNNAHKVGDALHGGAVTAQIDLYPELDMGALEKKLVLVFDANKNKTCKNVCKEILPEGTTKSILSVIAKEVDPQKKVHSITKEERKKVAQLLKALPVSISGLMGYERAVIADGGVALSEVDTKTMRSKKIRNLYITGDLLHVNRPSGGYSLQLCWTTGFVAGMSI